MLLKLNIFKILRSKFFPFYKSSELKEIFKILEKDHQNSDEVAMFVGGCVRNYLKNKDINDIDLATILTPDQIKQKFENTKFKVVETGIGHGSITLLGKNLKYEITTLRKDIKTDGRHAEVEFSTDWTEDSERRDFTINAIYLNKKGKIFDPQLGVKDLNNNIVKFIGDPEKRIQEDYLRILRFVRFSLTYGHQPENTTMRSIRLNIKGISKVSKERILIEANKILKLSNFIEICKNNNLKEIFEIIFQEFKYFKRLENLYKFKEKLNKDIFLLTAILVVDDKKNHEYFVHKYKPSNNFIKKLNSIAKSYEASLKNKDFFKKDLKKNIYIFGKEIITTLFLLKESEKVKNNIEFLDTIQKTEPPKFPYNGDYLISRGLKEGKELGDILKSLTDEPQQWAKYDTLVIDSLTEVQRLCKDDLTNKGRTQMKLQDWGKLADFMRRFIQSF